AGVSQGTLVVEAALESGSLITASLAVESGRDVFAIPGSIHSAHSRGCHRLIQEGAKLVESPEDVLRELRLAGATLPASLSMPRPSLFAQAADDATTQGPDGALRAALGHDPVTFDVLAARTGLPSDRLAARLLELELAGIVERLPGGLLQQRTRA
ncbi:MAG: DNA-protecting protein DprA, partial [Burkholderiales bacterium]|nr:DNA-protecting protein DprA [Burkholderiales bacterium]